MYHRILVPLDGSPTAEAGLREAFNAVLGSMCPIVCARGLLSECTPTPSDNVRDNGSHTRGPRAAPPRP